MDYTNVLNAVIMIGGLGLFIGLFLGVAAIIFKVKVDKKEEAILAILPGNNCGGCGFAGCANLAAAISKGEAACNSCPVGGSSVANKIAKVMGTEVEEGVRKIAYVKCQGTCDITKENYDYYGVEDCKMTVMLPNGGPKGCANGCLGYGSCVKVCPFEAISIVDGVAVVDQEKCKACGKCIAECPKQLIELVPYDAKYKVQCNSKDKGPVTMKVCEKGCIGCGLCVKNCPSGAIKVENFLAHIDYEKCTSCGTCMEKCVKKAIVNK